MLCSVKVQALIADYHVPASQVRGIGSPVPGFLCFFLTIELK
jgi:hypothetical protein